MPKFPTTWRGAFALAPWLTLVLLTVMVVTGGHIAIEPTQPNRLALGVLVVVALIGFVVSALRDDPALLALCGVATALFSLLLSLGGNRDGLGPLALLWCAVAIGCGILYTKAVAARAAAPLSARRSNTGSIPSHRRAVVWLGLGWLVPFVFLAAITLWPISFELGRRGLEAASVCVVLLWSLAAVHGGLFESLVSSGRLQEGLAYAPSQRGDARRQRARQLLDDARSAIEALGPMSSVNLLIERLCDVVPVATAALVHTSGTRPALIQPTRLACHEALDALVTAHPDLIAALCVGEQSAVLNSQDLGLTADGVPSCVAVVPLTGRSCADGAVVLVRTGTLAFAQDELQIAAEFGQRALEIWAQDGSRVSAPTGTLAVSVATDPCAFADGAALVSAHVTEAAPLSLLVLAMAGRHAPSHDAVEAHIRASVGDALVIQPRADDRLMALLPGVGADQSIALANTVCRQVAHRKGPKAALVTVHVGLASLNDSLDQFDMLCRAAERALYRAQRDGRARIQHHRDLVRGRRADGVTLA